ncbi:RAMP superfamily protein [Lyngbya aestuarii BL J]|uniref:RAMP superfamily protein n=2 Tax=Lyngbya aestuarii TaxID=118322 RepID=U7QMD6_9CYAN|nr:RAMP superfamily protein [Lyngbya aestuarii BL J]
MPLSGDNLERNKALLTGSSIAGALRNYLRERNKGYGKSDRRIDIAAKLFGDLFAYEDEKSLSEKHKIRLRENDTQSSLIIDDAISAKPIQSELRDGVKINSITRTAVDKAKYDLELLQGGTEFPLCFELLIEKDSNERELRKGLAIALSGLEQGEISLGMKKRRGFGRCHVKEWQVWHFNLEDPGDRMAWLKFEHWHTALFSELPSYSSIKDAFTQANINKVDFDELEREDQRDRFTINATFTLASPLLIRSGQAETGRAPDVVHLKSARIINEVKYFLASCLRQQMFSQAIAWLNLLPQEITVWTSENLELFLLAYFLLQPSRSKLPILSGTSLAGVLRHRAERIVKTLQCSFNQNPECDQEPEIIKSIFGHVENKRSQASRLIVREAEIEEYEELVQTRIAIDRFTGGAYHGALFQEQPVFANDETELKLEIELRNPDQHEIGLLLLLLKDLWTEDLPVGGSSSVGRGRLQGKEATLVWLKEGKSWTISQPDLKENYLEITGSDRQDLENYVNRLVEYAQQETTKNDQA